MFIARLSSQLLRASRAAAQLLSSGRPWPGSSLLPRCSPCCSNQAQPWPWQQLQPQLEELLVPRRFCISPLECGLALSYSLPAAGAPQEPPGMEEEQGGGAQGEPVRCRNVLRIRRRKMNRHKYRKLLKRRKFIRRRVKEGRKKKRQIKFERDLERVWKKAALKSAPAGWQTPKIYLRSSKR